MSEFDSGEWEWDSRICERGGRVVKARALLGISLWFLLACSASLADSGTEIRATDDWSVEVVDAQRSGRPVLILFSTEYCSYCERLKTEVLEPLLKRGELGNAVRIRELDIDRGGKIRDFDGEKVRTKVFVKRYGIYATPTLMLVDNRGEPLGAPIVGFNNQEDYMPLLDGFINVIGTFSKVVGSGAGSGSAMGAESS